MRPRFWETVPLKRMTREEWEALCDGCGKCCLNKLEDADTAEVAFTRVACGCWMAIPASAGNTISASRWCPNA